MDSSSSNKRMEKLEKSSDSLEYERKIQKELDANAPAYMMRYPLTATSLIVPTLENRAERHIKMTDTANPNKAIIYKAIVAAYNYAFFDPYAAVSNKSLYAQHAHLFVEWLNDTQIINRYDVLKKYEAFRFDLLENHGGLSALKGIKPLLTYACEYSSELQQHLSTEDFQYLQDLRKTKISPNRDKSQNSLASYFGQLDWLRRDDVGVGNELYTALSSPKLTVNSLSQTMSTILLEIERHKRLLRSFIIDNSIDVSSFEPNRFLSSNRYHNKSAIGLFYYNLISAFHLKGTSDLKDTMEIVLLSIVASYDSFLKLKSTLKCQSELDALFLCKSSDKENEVRKGICSYTFSSKYSASILSPSVIFALHSSERYQPITQVEALAFTWLMACLTVQPYDIEKLTHDSFRTLRMGDRVTDIECEYFKGRAKLFYQTRSLSTRTREGKAILSYLEQCKYGELKTLNKKSSMGHLRNHVLTLTGGLSKLLQLESVHSALQKAHKSQGDIPLIMPSTLVALIENAVTPQNVSIKSRAILPYGERIQLVQESLTPSLNGSIFGLRAIKNAAVHAFSDPYTLNYLLSRNSHSNKTEKLSYLNNDNEEWINSAGRITRAVMHDLINNVFALNFDDLNNSEKSKNIDEFNREFSDVTENISYRAGEMLARLCVVTEKDKGKINEIGVLRLSNQSEPHQDFEPLYVLDTPVTAFRMYNYLHEFKIHYKQLLSSNPEYLYKTAMPTVEWMEFTLNELSKENLDKGFELHRNAVKNGVTVSVFHSI